MHDDAPHPLLAQIPLTVSPFIHLPSSVTLPYTYKPLPSTLPPSSTPTTTSDEHKPKFVVSPTTAHAAHPDEIIASCRSLQAHLQRMQDEAERTLREWDEGVRERELAEKRRLAPGWLDREEKILEPERAGAKPDGRGVEGRRPGSENGLTRTEEGEELDRAFGQMAMR